MQSAQQTTVSPDSVEIVTRIVKNFFQKINLDANNQRMQLDSGLGWHVGRGSSLVYIFITKVENIDTVRVASPILYLPQENLLPLYRRCLELNFLVLNCAFAINKDMVFVISERAIQGLDAAEFEGMMNQVSYIADTYDDKLAQEFGARLYSQGR